MKVNMPVEAISEECITCPMLEIDIYTREKYDVKVSEDGNSTTQENKCENILKCRNYETICRRIHEHMAKEEAIEFPVKVPTKKPTVRKTRTKNTPKNEKK